MRRSHDFHANVSRAAALTSQLAAVRKGADSGAKGNLG
jgi:hypothetical protein